MPTSEAVIILSILFALQALAFTSEYTVYELGNELRPYTAFLHV